MLRCPIGHPVGLSFETPIPTTRSLTLTLAAARLLQPTQTGSQPDPHRLQEPLQHCSLEGVTVDLLVPDCQIWGVL